MLDLQRGGGLAIEGRIGEMSRLALRSAQDEVTDAERAVLQGRYEELAAEIEEVAATTEYLGLLPLGRSAAVPVESFAGDVVFIYEFEVTVDGLNGGGFVNIETQFNAGTAHYQLLSALEVAQEVAFGNTLGHLAITGQWYGRFETLLCLGDTPLRRYGSLRYGDPGEHPYFKVDCSDRDVGFLLVRPARPEHSWANPPACGGLRAGMRALVRPQRCDPYGRMITPLPLDSIAAMPPGGTFITVDLQYGIRASDGSVTFSDTRRISFEQ